jgi:hypothetical protein
MTESQVYLLSKKTDLWREMETFRCFEAVEENSEWSGRYKRHVIGKKM